MQLWQEIIKKTNVMANMKPTVRCNIQIRPISHNIHPNKFKME